MGEERESHGNGAPRKRDDIEVQRGTEKLFQDT